MAPEVMQGRAHAGAPSDVWSLGVTLASLLLPDHLPFWGKDLRELKQAHCRTAPMPQYTAAPMHQCTNAPMHRCPNAPMHQCTAAPMP